MVGSNKALDPGTIWMVGVGEPCNGPAHLSPAIFLGRGLKGHRIQCRCVSLPAPNRLTEGWRDPAAGLVFLSSAHNAMLSSRKGRGYRPHPTQTTCIRKVCFVF